jgi:hypothetical protein
MSTFDEALQDIKKAISVLEDQPSANNSIKHPDPKKHLYISLVKSATRIAAGVALIWPQSLILAGAFLIAAEILGIIEELV